MGTVVRLLGPLEVVVDGLAVTPAAPKVRALLALLALGHGRVLHADWLVGELWPDVDAEHGRRSLQVRVAELRRVLAGAADANIEFAPPGYRLAVERGALDVDVFHTLVDRGREALADGDLERARERLGQAVECFHDEPLVDVRLTLHLESEARRLADARLDAMEDWIDVVLAGGGDHEVVGLLDGLVATNPYRERLCAQWVLALYRCGRQAEALRGFAVVRRRLVEELGVEPGPELRALELAVLRQGPELDPKARARYAQPGTERAGRPAVPAPPPLRYARAPDGVNLGYRVLGDGPDLLVVPGFVSHLDMWWESPARRFVEQLSATHRLVLFDKRGTGLSDRPPKVTLDEWVDDVSVVLDAVGSERSAVFGMSAGGLIATLFAATRPERVTALVLYGSWSRILWGEDYPIGRPYRPDGIAAVTTLWGTGVGFDTACPSARDDPVTWEHYARYQRMAASPASAGAYMELFAPVDVRDALPAITAPTLVLHSRGDCDVPIAIARYMAEHICGAKLVELDSDDHSLHFHDALDAIIEETSAFLEATASLTSAEQR